MPDLNFSSQAGGFPLQQSRRLKYHQPCDRVVATLAWPFSDERGQPLDHTILCTLPQHLVLYPPTGEYKFLYVRHGSDTNLDHSFPGPASFRAPPTGCGAYSSGPRVARRC